MEFQGDVIVHRRTFRNFGVVVSVRTLPANSFASIENKVKFSLVWDAGSDVCLDRIKSTHLHLKFADYLLIGVVCARSVIIALKELETFLRNTSLAGELANEGLGFSK